MTDGRADDEAAAGGASSEAAKADAARTGAASGVAAKADKAGAGTAGNDATSRPSPPSFGARPSASDPDPGGGWIFAYGSLMWDPGVPVAEALPARLAGWHRSFCLSSIEHRGRPDLPGLVLGLDAAPEGECRGMALRIDAADWPEALAAIRARELVTDAYAELPVLLEVADPAGPRQQPALTYVVRRDHPQYAGGLDLDRQAAIIAAASGGKGPNAGYLHSFVAHLDSLGMPDPEFAALAARVRALVPDA